MKYTREQKLFGLPEQDQVMNEYKKLGYVLNKHDEEGLHMSFSPMRVARGLSRLQVRRRINKYFKHGNKGTPSVFSDNRMNIFINDRFVSGTSFSGKVPQNPKEFVKLLKDVINILTSKDVPDKEVLGKYSP